MTWRTQLPWCPSVKVESPGSLFNIQVRRLIVRSGEVSKPRDLYLKLFDRSEIWQAPRQQCCRCACQISKRCDNLNYQSRSFETSRDPTIRRHIGYWSGALVYAGRMTSTNGSMIPGIAHSNPFSPAYCDTTPGNNLNITSQYRSFNLCDDANTTVLGTAHETISKQHWL